MGDSKKVYIVGGRNYVQEPLVLGQWKQLLTTIKLPDDGKSISTQTIFSIIGENIVNVVAILLREEGKPLREKGVEELAENIGFEMSIDTATEVLDDFFLMNDIGLIMKAIEGLMDKITDQVKGKEEKEEKKKKEKH
jgi:hypothetical protein